MSKYLLFLATLSTAMIYAAAPKGPQYPQYQQPQYEPTKAIESSAPATTYGRKKYHPRKGNNGNNGNGYEYPGKKGRNGNNGNNGSEYEHSRRSSRRRSRNNGNGYEYPAMSPEYASPTEFYTPSFGQESYEYTEFED